MAQSYAVLTIKRYKYEQSKTYNSKLIIQTITQYLLFIFISVLFVLNS